MRLWPYLNQQLLLDGSDDVLADGSHCYFRVLANRFRLHHPTLISNIFFAGVHLKNPMVHLYLDEILMIF